MVGSNVVFSTVASGTGPYNYAWSKNGVAISGQTNSSLTLNNVTTSDAATYSVIVGGAIGTVTNSATLTVTKAGATVTLGNLNQTYDGSARAGDGDDDPERVDGELYLQRLGQCADQRGQLHGDRHDQ